jgi:hypothetical protein
VPDARSAGSAGSAGSRSSGGSPPADVLATVESLDGLTDASDPKALARRLSSSTSGAPTTAPSLQRGSLDLGMSGLWLQTPDSDADACWPAGDGRSPFTSQNGLVLDTRQLSGNHMLDARQLSGSQLSVGSRLSSGGNLSGSGFAGAADVVPSSFALRPPRAPAPPVAPYMGAPTAAMSSAMAPPRASVDLNPAFHSAPATIMSMPPSLGTCGVGSLPLGPAGAGRGGRGLREARGGGLSASFQDLQSQLSTEGAPLRVVSTRAAGLKHIGFGPFKSENQDEFFIQVGGGWAGGRGVRCFQGLRPDRWSLCTRRA